jgi:hypothetical protein
VRNLFEHATHPGIVVVPVRDLPPARTAVAWLTGNGDPSVAACAEIARSVS